MSMQQYGLTPYQESGSYEQELEFGAEAQIPGEYDVQGAEAEFGAHAEQLQFGTHSEGEFAAHGEFGEFGEFGAHAEQWETEAGPYEGSQFQEGPQSGEIAHAEMENPLSEQEEIQLTSELMEITTEAELEEFLGRLLAKLGSGVGRFLKSGVGRAIGGALKNVAKFALPLAGKALGTLIPIPGVGTALGGLAGTMVSRLFEVQSEGVDRQEYEFEVARRFVRLAAAAANNAALDQRQAAPQLLARDALLTAARLHAPGLARDPRLIDRPAPWYWPAPPPATASVDGAGRPGPDTGRPRSGRWVRYGRTVVVLGL